MTELRSIKDIIADLSKEIPDRHVLQRKQAGTLLDYIPWHTAVKYLDLYAPGWSYSIANIYEVGGMLVLVAKITIPCAEGSISREATGFEELPEPGKKKKMYGDPASNASSMALRRAAAHFGLGLYFYQKDRDQDHED